MNEKSCVQQKQDNFRVQIRRKQINQEFYKKRYDVLNKKIAQQQNALKQQLTTLQQKQQFVNNIAVFFVNHPSTAWELPLKKLLLSAKQFQNQGEIWLKTGIIQSLYSQLGLSSLAAQILADLVYYNRQDIGLIMKMLQFQFLEDLIQLCKNQQVCAYQYFCLFTQLMDSSHRVRDICIKRGLPQALFKKLKTPCMEDSMNQLQSGFNLTIRLVKIYNQDQYKKNPSGPIVSVMINVYDEAISTYRNNQNLLKPILKGISCILETETQFILKNAFYSKNIRGILFQMINSKDIQIRTFCIKSICLFASSRNNQYVKDMMNFKILDIIFYVSKIQNNNQNIKNLCLTVGNIIGNSTQQAEQTLRHSVFRQFILSQTHQSKPIKVRLQAIYCIKHLMQTNRLVLNDMLIKNYNCLEILILSMDVKDANLLSVVLSCFKLIILFYQNVYYEKGTNRVVDILQSIYNFSHKLNQVLDRSCNKLVVARANQLFELINT